MTDFDVVIIGGGLIGCASAYYLAKAGARVLLLERGQINQGASGQNAGSLHFQLEHRLIQNLDVHQRELEFYVGLAKLSIEDWKNIGGELDCDIQVAMHGGLMVAESAEQSDLLERKSKIEQSQGLSVNMLDGNQARELAPYLSESVVSALHCPDEGHCNPRLLTPAYARRAAASGASIITGAEVKAIERNGAGQGSGRASGWRLSFEQTGIGSISEPGSETEPGSRSGSGPGPAANTLRSVSCDKILNAAGAGAASIAVMANLHLPLFSVGLTMNATEKTGPVVSHLIQHVGRKLSLKQTDDGNLLIGGGWGAQLRQQHGRWSAGESPQLKLDSVLGNLRAAADVVPLVKDLRLIRTWTGTTCITADQLPVLGEATQAPGFFVAAGGSGFTYGPTYARLMSELMLSAPPSYSLKPFSPDRFGGLNAFMA